MIHAPQFNLPLDGETFALAGQREQAPACQRCGRAAFLTAGICEPCQAERAEDLIRSEARQTTFFV